MTGPRFRVSLLGPPLAAVDGRPIEVDTRKAIALLVYLAVEGRPQNRDTLATLLWPEYDQERARAALRRTLSTLKGALGGGWLEARRDAVTLDREGLWLDVDEFHRLLGECNGHGHPAGETCPACLGPLGKAAGLVRAAFLAGFGLRDSVNFDDWQFFQADGYARELAGVLDRLVEGHSARGEYEQAIEHARRRLSLDPLHEQAHRRLMELYAWSGERGAALRQYRECVRILDQELGVPPLSETTALSQAIKEGSAPPAPPTPPLPAAEPRGYPMVGRAAEWKALLETYADVGPDGRLLVLEGEAGIGKTRLVDELLAHAGAQGAVAVAVRCFPGEAGLAYGPVIELLRGALRKGDPKAAEPWWTAEAGRLLPELGQPPSPSLDSPGAQARFFEALTGLLLAATGSHPPGVLALDDVHWADDASLAVLTYLVRRLRGRPVLLAATWRPEEIPPGHPARRLLAEALRDGIARVVSPSRLSRPDVAELVEAAGRDVELAAQLHEEAGGLPFFVVEYLKALEDSEQGWALPGSIRDLLRARLDAVGEIAGQVLATAAVIGRSFEFEAVRDASGRTDEETVTALEELSRSNLIAEDGSGTYDFRHEQARALAYESTSLARRRLLHRRIAEALTVRDGSNASAIAHHYRLAGQDTEAAEQFKLAGEQASRLYANAEALAHFHTALALGHREAGALREAIGDLQTLAGDYGAALTSYDTAAAQAGPEGLAAIEHKIGLVHHRRGEWELAEGAFESALVVVAADDVGRRARIAADRSLTARQRGLEGEARALAEEALTLAERADDAPALAQAHNILGILAAKPDEARRHLEQSLALAVASGDLAARVAALNNLALAYRTEGELERALEVTEEALALCVSQGDRHREAALRNNRADLLHDSGRPTEAMDDLKQAVAIFAEIGAEGSMQPEIWKLVEW